MKITHLSLVLAGVMALSFGVQAAGESTITLGYAQSHVKLDDNSVDGNPKGFNLKYRYEIQDDWGAIGSFVYTKKSYDRNNVSGELKYYSLTGGPTYRFNEYISVYGLLGLAHGQATVDGNNGNFGIDDNKTNVVGGLGLQGNVTPNIAIDAHYEYAKLNDFKVGTWTLGAGYRF